MSYRTSIAAIAGVVSAWDFDETAGATTAADYVGSNPLTYQGTNTLGADGIASGTAFSMAGGGGANLASSPATGDCTIECWAHWTSSNGEQAVFKNGGSGNGYALVVNGNSTNNGRYYLLREGIAWHDTGINCPTYPHHVALTRSGTTYNLYINGSLAWNNAAGNPNTPTALSVGRGDSGGRLYQGRIDAASISNAVLSAATIKRIAYSSPLFNGAEPAASPLPGGAAIRRDLDIARGLVVACPFARNAGAPVNLVDGGAVSIGVSSYTWGVAGRYGPQFTTTLGVNCNMSWTHGAYSQQSFTAEVLLTINSLKTGSPWISGIWTNIPASSNTGAAQFRLGNSAVAPDRLNFGSNLSGVRMDRPVLLTLVSTPSGATLYRDGAAIETASAFASGTFTQTYLNTDDSNGSSRPVDATWHQYNLWGRPLSAAEVGRRARDPWELYRPRRPSLAVLAGATARGGLVRPVACDGLGGSYFRNPLGA